MKERINWIDWVKAWCMTVVVFDHTPHDGSPFLLQYLAATNISAFFFISGYLKKPIMSQSGALKKYFYCLIIPYIIYNILCYPYWWGKFYIEHGGQISFFESIKPIIGTFLGQLNSSFSCTLNGVTWFLLSLFMMHWITDLCDRSRYRLLLMVGISLLAIVLYGANKYYHYAPYLTFHGLVRCICFFFMGHLVRQTGFLKETEFRKDLITGFTALVLSLLLFYWHIHEDSFIIHIILFFVVNSISIIAFVSLFRCLNHVKLRCITYISIGTMVIFGLHRILIGIIDYGVEKAFHISDVTYDWYECVLITVIIEAILLPFILWAYHKYPILLGKKANIHKRSDKLYDNQKYL